MSEAHDAAVSKISARVKEFYDLGKPFRVYHGSTNTTRRSTRSPETTVDVSGLNNVLSVSTDSKTALVEPNVPMDGLVAATLKYGLVPPVVMEFPGITAGGAFAGTGGESSSFRYGTFDRIVNRIEIVLPNGDAVWASDEEKADLFNGSAGALGTFGVLTLLEIQLVPAKGKTVELQYHPIRSVTQAVTKSREFCQESAGWDYVDGIMYSLESGAVITGKLVPEDADKPVTARYWGAGDNWYYSDVQEKLETRPGGWTDVVPIEDYLFRYDRGGFWCGRTAFQDLHIPFNSWTRWMLDNRLRTRVMFDRLHMSGSISRSVIQDLCIPAKNLDDFVNHVNQELSIWPLWLCPIRSNAGRGLFQLSDTENMADDKFTDNLYINVGVWGINKWGYGLARYDEAIEKNRGLEHKVHALGGYKWLYSQTFYTEEEFWNVYPREKYDALRKKYHATSLPTVYEKVRTDVEGERQFLSSWKSGQLYEILAKTAAFFKEK